MQCMNARTAVATLPLPEPRMWLTRKKVARMCDVDPATVSRWAASGVLTGHLPQATDDESPQPLFWVHEVEDLIAARKRTGAQR